MTEKEDGVVQNIDFKNKAKPVPAPEKINDIDVSGEFYKNIIEGAESGLLDMTQIDAFTNVSRSRDQVYSLIDMMGEDPVVASALEIYASDVCEPNEKGDILWATSDDDKCLNCVNNILEDLAVDKNIYGWAYSLVKYGDLYLRLYRDSDYNKKPKEDEEEKTSLNETLEKLKERSLEEDSKESLQEKVILKAYSKNDHYAAYMEAVKNPAEVFNLTQFGKSAGYIKTSLSNSANLKNDYFTGMRENQFFYKFQEKDVQVLEATEMVHACLQDNSDRTSEEVTITDVNNDGEEVAISYSVKRGQSLLYDAFNVWRELKLLENAVLLNRLTKSSIIRAVNVEVGDMEKNDVKRVVAQVKQMIEQKSAIKTGSSMTEYTNPGPIENTIYMPTHDGKGAITTTQVGGDVNVGELTDLDWWKNKLYGALGIPKQYLGDTDDATGFNGGTSLSLVSSRFAKSIKRIQSAILQAITDGVNLILLDRKLTNYIGEFRLMMQAPATQEEKDRKENISNSINNIREIMSLLDPIENQKTKLTILKTLLSDVVSDSDVIQSIQDEIDNMDNAPMGGDDDFSGDFGGDFGGGDLGGDFGNSEPLDLDAELPTPEETGGDLGAEPEGESPIEAFYNARGGELLNEGGDLPSFSELGISYTDVR